MARRAPAGPGRESVWDYPRPPRVEPTNALVRIELCGRVITSTRAALRVLETSHPPVFYVPAADTDMRDLVASSRSTFCEYKGRARYYDAPGRPAVAWWYPDPSPGYEALVGHLAFYPGRVDRATVDGEEVVAQAGDFYGGWITSAVAGPFKGAPGTSWW
jgi:uncharacterized protein (DUF427 family)